MRHTLSLVLAVLALGCNAGPYAAALMLPPNAPPRADVECASPRLCVQEVAAGPYRTCARLLEGDVYCWGNNERGQLLDGTTTSRPKPVRVEGLSGAVRLGLGAAHTCALLTDATVACWGYNTAGQLGSGRTSPEVESPLRAGGLSDVVELATGDNHTCARRKDGSVWCWGANESGQLGVDRSTRAQPRPAPLPGVSGATAIGLGSRHTCVLTADGTVRCWGWRTDLSTQSLPGTTALALGGLFGCALLGDGSARCWGQNDQGQLGDGRRSEEGGALETAPRPVSGLDGALAVDASHTHACALLRDGTVRCWGSNWTGEVGDGTAELKLARTEATPVQGLRDAVQVSAGGSCFPQGGAHACALLREGTVHCWGDNASGQLGDGTTRAHSLPAPVSW